MTFVMESEKSEILEQKGDRPQEYLSFMKIKSELAQVHSRNFEGSQDFEGAVNLDNIIRLDLEDYRSV